MYRSFPIASGVASLASWAQQSQDVTIIPVAIGYRHAEDPQGCIRTVIKKWEHQSGISLNADDSTPIIPLLHSALDHTLDILSRLYDVPSDEAIDPGAKIALICDEIMKKGESLAGLNPEGTILDRLFKLRYKGMQAIHPVSLNPFQLAPVARSLADYESLKAHVFLRHSQIVDVLQYIDPSYIEAPCSAGRACEFALNLLDVLNRIQGGDINGRFSPRGKKAIVSIGTPITLSSLDPNLPSKGKKARLKHITDEVQHALGTSSAALESYWESKVFEA